MTRVSRSAATLMLGGFLLGCTGSIEGSSNDPDLNQDETPARGAGGSRGAPAPRSGSESNPASPATDARHAALAPARIARLTATQYRNSVRDLLGVEVPGTTVLEEDFRVQGSSAMGASVASISALGVEQFEQAALDVAVRRFAEVTRRQSLVPCDPSQDACRRQFLEGFGRRAWRRPLTAAESDLLATLARDAAGKLQDPWLALAHVAAGTLQSPKFLFQLDLGEADPSAPGRLRYSGYEMASRLSFLLWNTTPDGELLDAAARGELTTSEGVRKQVLRLIDSPRAIDAIVRQFEELLSTDDIPQVEKDQKLFPLFKSATIRDSMRGEILRVLQSVVEGDADLRTLLDTRSTFVDGELAKLYGLPSVPTGAGLTAVQLPGTGVRRGVLGTAGWLALHASPTDTTPTARGKFIQESLLCRPVPPAPDDVDTSIPEGPTASTRREQLTVHRASPVCAACHALMDPIGLGLENFDAGGAFRTTERNLPIDASGELDGARFRDAGQLVDLLRDHPRLIPCLLTKLYQHSTGQALTDGVPALADRWTQASGGGAYRAKALLAQIAQSDAFRYAALPTAQEGP